METIMKNEEQEDLDKLHRLVQSIPADKVPLVAAFIEGFSFRQLMAEGKTA